MVEDSLKAEDCQKKAAELGFDLTKQFLTLAFAGIAFVVGLSFNTPGSVSSLLFWSVIVTFGLSALLGLAFLMHGVSLLNEKKQYDIYASSLRFLSGLQIVLMLVGTALLVPILARRSKVTTAPATSSVEIKLGPQQTVIYPIDSSKNLTIELDGGKVKVTESTK
jgi:membrane protein implicated in regulation of membrane protease activity